MVLYWFNVYDCLFCAHSTNHELPMHRHNASYILPHCIVLRSRYCLDRVTPSRVNVLQLKDCKWNCQMNWAIGVVSRKLLIMISFDRTAKFSIVTKKRKHFEPQAFCYFTQKASTSVVDYGTILRRGRTIQVAIISVPFDILLHIKWFFFRCTEVNLAEKKNPKSSYIFCTCNVQLQHKNFVVVLFWTSTGFQIKQTGFPPFV